MIMSITRIISHVKSNTSNNDTHTDTNHNDHT